MAEHQGRSRDIKTRPFRFKQAVRHLKVAGFCRFESFRRRSGHRCHSLRDKLLRDASDEGFPRAIRRKLIEETDEVYDYDSGLDPAAASSANNPPTL